ncbi:hypothetical protein ZIOFF_021169 [Zingiber officinale]|uniref:Uncharacterized protein n=1 Tax=Zingiber officinale TaxID=94328 RepID=A0A8J5L8C2_ZINOF|nr:hypothetical protein ZIOFF_021169 [Zingiber officinale]
MAIDRRTDKLIRRTAMVGTATAAYLLLTADYGPQDNALLPVMRRFRARHMSIPYLPLALVPDSVPACALFIHAVAHQILAVARLAIGLLA